MASVAVIFVFTMTLGAILAREMGQPILKAGTRIVDGSEAIAGLLPYMAYIESRDNSGTTTYSAGSLITTHAVLTAAWHVEGYTRFTIRLGSIYRTDFDPNAWTVNSTWALVHPNYNETTQYNDAAIIFLPKKAPLNDYIQLAHLPSSPNVPSFIGSRGIVSGWGFTKPDSGVSQVLRWAQVVVVPNEICRNFLPETTAITGQSLCAGSTNTTVYVYDRGAPLVLRTGWRFQQIGIYSVRADDAYGKSFPALYTRVSSILAWIKSNTGLDYEKAGGMRTQRRMTGGGSLHRHPHI